MSRHAKRIATFGTLLAFGGAQVAAYAFFKARSGDFIARNHNAAALDFSRAHALVLPAILNFGAGEVDARRLGAGWNLPEPGGVWSSEKDAWLELALARPIGNLDLRLDVVAFPTSPPRQTLHLTANLTPIGKAMALDAGHNRIEVLIPATLAQSGLLQLGFHVDRCESPLREGVGTDPRWLGVGVQAIEIVNR